MLAPGNGTDYLQVIDVRDLASFACTLLERDLSGPFNLAGPRLTWRAFLELLGATELQWVSAELLRAAGVTLVELPLFREDGGARSSLMDVRNQRALAAGLTLRDPAASAAHVRAWLRGQELPLALSPAREAELLDRARRYHIEQGRRREP
jgi:2'-hydroxyisoflavone reductase